MILWILFVFVGETKLTNGTNDTTHDLQGCVETLLWELVSGSTYVDHGQTVVTLRDTSPVV